MTGLADLTFRVIRTADVTTDVREQMHDLFDITYREADHSYLDRAFNVLRFAALATHGDEPAGFALGDMRVVDLPSLPGQKVAMAGICCVAPAFRRRGLFGALELHAMNAAGLDRVGRVLSAGRMAHPASMRTMARLRDVVPQAGVRPTAWQRAVGSAIATLYGAAGFDPETFVCAGAGRPIGYPVMDLDVEPDEWRVFEEVDRGRGDSLLGLGWLPAAPDGWRDAGPGPSAS